LICDISCRCQLGVDSCSNQTTNQHNIGVRQYGTARVPGRTLQRTEE